MNLVRDSRTEMVLQDEFDPRAHYVVTGCPKAIALVQKGVEARRDAQGLFDGFKVMTTELAWHREAMAKLVVERDEAIKDRNAHWQASQDARAEAATLRSLLNASVPLED